MIAVESRVHAFLIEKWKRPASGRRFWALFSTLLFHCLRASAQEQTNQPPVLLSPIPDQTNYYGNAFSYTFPADTFAEPDDGQTLSYAASNLPPDINFDGVTRTFSGTNTTVGSYTVTVMATDDGSPPLSTNVTFEFVSGKTTLALTADDQVRAYGGVISFFSITFSGFVLGDEWWTLDFFSFALCDADPASPIGQYPITLFGGTDSHYEIVLTDGTLTITNAPLLVRGDSLCRQLGHSNPPLTGTVAGLQNNDNISATFATTATLTSPLGDYPITLLGLNDPDSKLTNYTVTAINGALSVVDFDVAYQRLRSFGFTNLMGTTPVGGLREGSDGKFYGTTLSGGVADKGVVFAINPDGSGYSALHHFTSVEGDGESPAAGVFEGSDGALYGTTLAGGANDAGTVFKLEKNGAGYQIIRQFTAIGGDGEAAVDLIEATNGMLYGFTLGGNLGGKITLFQLKKDGSGYGVLHEFIASEGIGPRGLFQGSDGMLYGTTSQADSFAGALFKVNLDGTAFTLLHSFDYSTDGGSPVVREVSDQLLYGTTASGGPNFNGTVFKIASDGTGFTLLFDFPSSQNDGSNPQCEVIEGNDGALYGTTQSGGAHDSGTVFKLNKDGSSYTVLRHWGQSAIDGLNPIDHLVQNSDGNLYGAAYLGGVNDAGTLFKLANDGSDYITIWHFHITGLDGANGPTAYSSVIEATDGTLYGTTADGGASLDGTVFKINRDGSGYMLLHNFDGNADGRGPGETLLEGSDGWLYGSTRQTLSGGGNLFKLNKDGSGFGVLYSFGGISNGDGDLPKGALVEAEGVLFGVTQYGGTNFSGTVFKIYPDGTGYEILRHLAADEAPFPQGLIRGHDGVLYGISAGDFFSEGGIFRINTDGSGFLVLQTFGTTVADGFGGAGALIQGSDDVLYGTTTFGGAYNGGTVFRLNTDGTGSVILRNLGDGGHDARSPVCGLVEGPDGALFGTGRAGGIHGDGAVFRITRDGVDYCLLHSFESGAGDGSKPGAAFLSAGDGWLYGTSQTGGQAGFGTAFKLLITHTNNAPPQVANLIPDQTNTYGSLLSYTFSSATFTEPDSGQTLTYSAIGLPPGMDFEGPSRTFSGTPTNAGTYPITVTATDDGVLPLSTNSTFQMTIAPAALIVAADNQSRPYGQTNPSLTGSFIGVTNSDPITVAFSTSAMIASPPGDYPILAALNDPEGRLANYAVSVANGTLTVLCTNHVTVTTTDDSGPGSLREALIHTCSGGSINFAVVGTISLSNGVLQVDKSVNIIGPGASELTLSGLNTNRVLAVLAGPTTISDLTIADGTDASLVPLGGGGIRNGASLALWRCAVVRNTGYGPGGGIHNSGTLFLHESLIASNTALELPLRQGGGVANIGTMFATNSTFADNHAGDGGGIYSSGEIVLDHCTIAFNSAGFCDQDGCIGTGGGIHNDGGTLLASGTLIAGNTNNAPGAPDYAGLLQAGDYNLVGVTNGLSFPGTHNFLGIDARALPLAANGGPTFTVALQLSSPAIDAGPLDFPLTDQRGTTRPQGTTSDIGAFEAIIPPTPPTLHIAKGGPNAVVISWFPTNVGFALQQNASLNPLTWTNAVTGSTNPIIFSVETTLRYFRLYKP